MKQFESYNIEKENLKKRLTEFKNDLLQGKEVGLIDDDDLKKIDNVIKTVEDDKLRIALVGAFSDGKTSVIAAWLGQVLGNMKINTDESSDRLEIYKPIGLSQQDIEIVDTPGLFGDKEKEQGGKTIKFSDVTRKYLSEAHLLFYVVGASNPIKDSHKETIHWILRDLNKLSTTIFIINKMDEVADLSDEEDFEDNAQIKQENVIGKLRQMINLTADEEKQLNIVCLSANPQGKGLQDYWFERKEKYEERSRIDKLRQRTNTILANTTKSQLVGKTGIDVIGTVLKEKIKNSRSIMQQLDATMQEIDTKITETNKDRALTDKDLRRNQSELFEALKEYENKLLTRIRSSSVDAPDELVAVLEEEIGHSKDEVGYKLEATLNKIISDYAEKSNVSLKNLSVSLEDIVKKADNILAKSTVGLAKQGLHLVSKMPINNLRNAILAGRKFLFQSYKFKPRGALKLAGNIGKAAGAASAGITVLAEGWEIWKKHRDNKKFEEAKSQISEYVKDTFKEIYPTVSTYEKYIENYVSSLSHFDNITKQFEQEYQDYMKQKKNVDSWESVIKNKYKDILFKDAVDVNSEEVK
jgi:hypothetical protein